jgi:hypothetical protein
VAQSGICSLVAICAEVIQPTETSYTLQGGWNFPLKKVLWS